MVYKCLMCNFWSYHGFLSFKIASNSTMLYYMIITDVQNLLGFDRKLTQRRQHVAL